VLFFYGSAVFWLMIGTIFALLASLKLHSPNLLADTSWLTFGRIRPAHLDVVAYGWSAMAGLGTALWLICRLCRVPLRFPAMPLLAGIIWDIGVAAGTIGVLSGQGNSIEWIEFPQYATFLLFIAFAIVAIWAVMTFAQRREQHVYVSLWYLFAAMFWFPWVYATVQILMNSPFAVKGTAQESIHWWFGHNVLGVFFTPIGLATIYYMIPKVIGRPIYSYYLSILGFWSLALFYNWAGGHHLVAGPVPAWLITVSAVCSIMMFIPVTTTAINHHMTAYRFFSLLRYSPTLRFTVFGAMAYTVVSFQGSLMAVRIFNEPFHFTHHTIAHAHLGLYAFYTMAMFGAMYYIVPRLTGREWASARLIRTHFWATAIGVILMFLVLSLGGFVQGFEMNQASKALGPALSDHTSTDGTLKGLFTGIGAFFDSFKTRQDAPIPFIVIVRDTIPWLWARSASGVLLFVGHLAFATLILLNFTGFGRPRGAGPTLFSQDSDGYADSFGSTNGNGNGNGHAKPHTDAHA
jgi:cytochrome c oxidase cbb3-type subunit 1